MNNPYKLLGVSPTATDEEIKRAYRDKCRENHPDHGGSTELMAELNLAYKKIDTAEHRAAYDAANSFSTTFSMWESVFGKSDVAKNFGNAPAANKKMRNGSDISVKVKIDMETFINGTNFMTVPYEKTNECLMCSGTGIAKQCRCPKCGGIGKVHSIKRSDAATIDRVVQCRTCHGTGAQVLEKCEHCDGTGETIKRSTYSFRYTPFMREMTIVGKGNEGAYGGENGKLLIKFDVTAAENVTIDDAIHYLLYINPEDAVLGAVKDIELGGRLVNITIPATGELNGEVIIDNIFDSGMQLKVSYRPMDEDVNDENIISSYKTLRENRKRI